jgi:DNA-binding NtrC family response regulator
LNSFRVLFVDDEEELVSTLVERLEYRGIIADYAVNGNQAQEKLQHEKYNVMVVDLKLPGLSGEELVHIVNKTHPNLPVLMITGHGSGKDGSFEKPNGVFELLQKPIDISVLIKKMEEAIEANEPG